MLYKFKSPAAADVILMQGPAEQILKVIGKSPSPTGIVTLEQIPAALAALRAEVQRLDALKAQADHAEESSEDESAQEGKGDVVRFAQRVVPFIHLLELTQAEGKNVVWGV